jgi:hypothetical protein
MHDTLTKFDVLARAGAASLALVLVLATCQRGPGPAQPALRERAARATGDAGVIEIDTRAWVGASDVVGSRGEYPQSPVCMIDAGCPADPLPLPPCPRQLLPRDVMSVVADAAHEMGKRLVVRGRLEAHALQTLRECAMSCCNGARGALTLDGVIALRDSRHPTAFACVGDDSWLCCPFETGLDVAVVGTLGASPSGQGYLIEQPRLCAVERVPVEAPVCAHRGRRFENGATLVVRRPTCERWHCTGGTWSREPIRCIGRYPLAWTEFEPTEFALGSRQLGELSAVEAVLDAPEYVIVLRSIAAPGQGAKLAEFRAAAVRSHLVKRGFEPSRVSVEVVTPRSEETEPLAHTVVVLAALR